MGCNGNVFILFFLKNNNQKIIICKKNNNNKTKPSEICSIYLSSILEKISNNEVIGWRLLELVHFKHLRLLQSLYSEKTS